MKNKYQIAVIGGGHAGIEAAIIAAKMGMRTLLVTLEKSKIGTMSCNPAIGGLAKGQLAREVDALGGIMGRIIDEAGIHFKMLNTSKGPAVQSPRAQADRALYIQSALKHIENTPNLTILEDMGVGLRISNGSVNALLTEKTGEIPVDAVILTAGTFLNGKIFTGLSVLSAGRAGEMPAKGMTEALVALGFRVDRLKTGTPPRIHRDSIDYKKMIFQKPDKNPQPFSYATDAIHQKQVDCYITHTNTITHEILKEGFMDSPLFTGRIKGKGPRYCPSVEDKVNRFADKDRHQLFLEPEGYDNAEIYVNGFSTSLPGEIQEKALKTVHGLENVKILRLGYAVEYDFFPPDQVKRTLETKEIENLYFAGQINGTSGYEEAAAQGLIAGINAARKLQDKEPFYLERSDAYIGVLIDDLINKTHDEPYRMFTSRAEFRLLLRQDNADIRLMEKGRNLGLIDDRVYKKFQNRLQNIHSLQSEIDKIKIEPEKFNQKYSDLSTPIKQAISVINLVKRPEIALTNIIKLTELEGYSEDVIKEIEFNIKYDGYINRQNELLDKFRKIEDRKIPENLEYLKLTSLSQEAREKLNKIKPYSLGQASRISGVSHADLNVLLIYLEKYRNPGVSRET